MDKETFNRLQDLANRLGSLENHINIILNFERERRYKLKQKREQKRKEN